MSMSIRKLRELARLNLCNNCFRRYLSLIEPSVRLFRYRPLRDWGEIENHITWMTMKLNGVYKQKDPAGPILLDIGDGEPEEAFSKDVDVKAFREIQKNWGFMKKARYLREQGILKTSSFKLLVYLSEIRNKLHKPDYEFRESELRRMFQARPLFTALGWRVLFSADQNLISQIVNSVEKQAEKMLQEILRR